MPVSGRIVRSSRFILLGVVSLLFLLWTAAPTLAEVRKSKARATHKNITKIKTDKKKIAKIAKKKTQAGFAWCGGKSRLLREFA